MADKRQLDRTDKEKNIIRTMFNDNEALQRALRDYFFQLPLTSEQEGLISSLTNEQIEILRKEMLPSIADNKAVGMSNDVWSGISADGGVQATYPRILVRRLMIKYTEQQIDGLTTGNRDFALKLSSFIDEEKMDKGLEFNGVSDDFELYVKMTAYLTILKTVELHLLSLWFVANQDIKTPDEITESLKKDSSE